ncbi:hypothetical protein G3N55_06075 [Dissulfurirhabdus thermomarina]|uniref:Fervidolysin-like N-terminal prodomain domain-containing protein n=1 Tax=Dissulfurirhabdus thermomarina TaxID=1765737 RepID=A0A6N9TMX4_DISTH|nr:hypothetical protein [Dissulfurirhabdus thermomarina]NDY42408.1 hypothetical protein [Dissulfurirhabdus thermomarina]NMX23822.1 hypothetical protein [Dissulfurirhabdus thermomarina]
MTSERERLRGLLPLYLNGSLPEGDRAAVEAALERDPGLQAELQECREIAAAFEEMERCVPCPSEAVYGRILQGVRETVPGPSPSWRRWTAPLRDLRLAWGLAAVQAAAILLLLVAPPGSGLRTLTAPRPTAERAVAVNVVFRPDAREQDIRALLVRVGATIVDGPSPEGLYVIRVPPGARPEALLERLRRSGVVRFARQAY